MLIELPPHIEQLVISQAKSEQLSVAQLIEKWASESQTTKPTQLGDRLHQLFAKADFPNLDIQRTDMPREMIL